MRKLADSQKPYFSEVRKMVRETTPGATSANRPSGSFFVFASEAEAEAFEERAAIREFDGGLVRVAAERLAAFDIVRARATAHGSNLPQLA